MNRENVNKWFEENMCVSLDKFIENWDEQKQLTEHIQQERDKYKSIVEELEEHIYENPKLAQNPVLLDFLIKIKELEEGNVK